MAAHRAAEQSGEPHGLICVDVMMPEMEDQEGHLLIGGGAPRQETRGEQEPDGHAAVTGPVHDDAP